MTYTDFTHEKPGWKGLSTLFKVLWPIDVGVRIWIQLPLTSRLFPLFHSDGQFKILIFGILPSASHCFQHQSEHSLHFSEYWVSFLCAQMFLISTMSTNSVGIWKATKYQNHTLFLKRTWKVIFLKFNNCIYLCLAYSHLYNVMCWFLTLKGENQSPQHYMSLIAR